MSQWKRFSLRLTCVLALFVAANMSAVAQRSSSPALTGPMAMAAARQGVHPCDAVVAPNPNVTGAQKVGFCFSGKREDGSTNTDPVTVRIYIGVNSTPSVTAILTSGTFIASTGLNPAGLRYYETASTITFPVGATSFRVTLATPTSTEASSVPFAFTVGVAPLAAPVGLRVVGS